jgi:phosphoribosylformylglycinamidine synthase PurS subunit
MPLDVLLDPQGKAVEHALHSLLLNMISNVRIGKHIRFELESDDEKSAVKIIETACQKLLVNPVSEGFKYKIREIKG